MTLFKSEYAGSSFVFGQEWFICTCRIFCISHNALAHCFHLCIFSKLFHTLDFAFIFDATKMQSLEATTHLKREPQRKPQPTYNDWNEAWTWVPSGPIRSCQVQAKIISSVPSHSSREVARQVYLYRTFTINFKGISMCCPKIKQSTVHLHQTEGAHSQMGNRKPPILSKTALAWCWGGDTIPTWATAHVTRMKNHPCK